MPLKDDLLKLSRLPRSRKNLEKIQGQLEELEELGDSEDEISTALESLRSALEEFTEAEGSDENPFSAWVSGAQAAAVIFLGSLPEEREGISDVITGARGKAEEYENCLEDADYSAENREEIWGELLDALENIAERAG